MVVPGMRRPTLGSLKRNKKPNVLRHSKLRPRKVRIIRKLGLKEGRTRSFVRSMGGKIRRIRGRRRSKRHLRQRNLLNNGKRRKPKRRKSKTRIPMEKVINNRLSPRPLPKSNNKNPNHKKSKGKATIQRPRSLQNRRLTRKTKRRRRHRPRSQNRKRRPRAPLKMNQSPTSLLILK